MLDDDQAFVRGPGQQLALPRARLGFRSKKLGVAAQFGSFLVVQLQTELATFPDNRISIWLRQLPDDRPVSKFPGRSGIGRGERQVACQPDPCAAVEQLEIQLVLTGDEFDPVGKTQVGIAQQQADA